jgi:hypothetical protein
MELVLEITSQVSPSFETYIFPLQVGVGATVYDLDGVGVVGVAVGKGV